MSRGPRKKQSPIAAALAPHGFPSAPGPGLGFTAEDDERLARGWPEMRVITDEPVKGKAAVRLASKALDAIEHMLPLVMPRAVAARYLVGYSHGPNLFVHPDYPAENAQRREARDAAVAAPPVVDLELLRTTLRAPHARGMGDTYRAWRFREVLFLYEAFLGTEPVARTLTEHLVGEAKRASPWPDLLKIPNRTNAAMHHLALVLPWLLLRLPAAVAAALRAELATVRKPEDVSDEEPRAFFALLHALANPSAPLHDSAKALRYELALCAGDADEVARGASLGYTLLWYPARIAWLVGTDIFAGKLTIAVPWLHRIAQELLLVRDPGVVRLIAHVATVRTGKTAAATWLRAHGDYARPILDSLAALPQAKEQRAARAAAALLDMDAPAATDSSAPG
ncbi:hypothetical protein [Polyangium sp. 6x1]|uniref:hypothetical protein n=1 Tax=Polyangium sp. 6x1 TaxID=3042689 RepID=UPI0024825C91|nr:hypothetical protein [Polyangium sp. 6x1]MDI1443550.1 hypothetical protein [Polyangium sp. 6x1]